MWRCCETSLHLNRNLTADETGGILKDDMDGSLDEFPAYARGFLLKTRKF